MASTQIHGHTNGERMEQVYGYLDRVVPCTDDKATCEYLDAVYSGHTNGVRYAGYILTTLIFAYMFACLWSTAILCGDYGDNGGSDGESSNVFRGLRRVRRTAVVTCRQHLLPERMRFIFGRTTQYQIVVLTLLVTYISIWTFVGIRYQSWVIPVEDGSREYKTYGWLGILSNRLGTFSYLLLILSVWLGCRDSILSQLLGIPHQSFMFLHRWVGYLMLAQAALHSIGWSVVGLTNSQPNALAKLGSSDTYIYWGIAAMCLLVTIWAFSLPVEKGTIRYDLFRPMHFVLVLCYMGTLYFHWSRLAIFIIPSFALIIFDKLMRVLAMYLLHRRPVDGDNQGSWPYSANARVKVFQDPAGNQTVRLDFQRGYKPWQVGQHFYLCFIRVGLWRAHPHMPLNDCVREDNGLLTHSYLFRAKLGDAAGAADVAAAKDGRDSDGTVKTPVVLTGPWGVDMMRDITPDTNVLCVAGGTGISYVLPVLLRLTRHPNMPNRLIKLVWLIRYQEDLEWIRPELDTLRVATGIIIRVLVTRETWAGAKENKLAFGGESLTFRGVAAITHPEPPFAVFSVMNVGADDNFVRHLTEAFIGETVRGRTTVFASGPGGMITHLRSAVARCNRGERVWRGNERYDVELVCDDRLDA